WLATLPARAARISEGEARAARARKRKRACPRRLRPACYARENSRNHNVRGGGHGQPGDGQEEEDGEAAEEVRGAARPRRLPPEGGAAEVQRRGREGRGRRGEGARAAREGEEAEAGAAEAGAEGEGEAGPEGEGGAAEGEGRAEGKAARAREEVTLGERGREPPDCRSIRGL